eukprot:gnl/Spiro4/15993_TR8603_c0_g1_i1.p1 gnl/Spiro4/15993_TR8603_c0_g1~~gnl/Spiro4/15993_TR8603_c0_g1_i1.p1  ORF type:complete len:185 (-),score=17.97 gnl/Spiro4/15993_TR8603_c0_g1_i1:17-571(-)
MALLDGRISAIPPEKQTYALLAEAACITKYGKKSVVCKPYQLALKRMLTGNDAAAEVDLNEQVRAFAPSQKPAQDLAQYVAATDSYCIRDMVELAILSKRMIESPSYVPRQAVEELLDCLAVDTRERVYEETRFNPSGLIFGITAAYNPAAQPAVAAHNKARAIYRGHVLRHLWNSFLWRQFPQ